MSQLPLFILYGSATGNSEKIASDLAASYANNVPPPFTEIICCPGNDFKRKCTPIWEIEPTGIIGAKYGLILIMSTTGNGDSPENSSRFMRYLKRKTTPQTKPFQHVAFGVLGLGDTNYEKFCQAAKASDSFLQKCAGTRAVPLGCADEATGLEDVVEDWIGSVVPMLAKTCCGEVVHNKEVRDINAREEKKEELNDVEEKKEDVAEQVAQAFNGSRPTLPVVRGSKSIASPIAVGSRPNVRAIRSRMFISHDEATSTEKSNQATELEASKVVSNRPSDLSVAATVSNKTVSNKVESTKTVSFRSQTPLCILYGSETGNAEHIAKDLATKYEKMLSNSSASYFPKVICCELNKYKKECQGYWEDDSSLKLSACQKHGLLIIVSTTGNGDAPENASRFVRYIKRKSTLDSNPFRNVAFAVLGLGDTNYEQFCCTSKVVDKKIHELGGTRVKKLVCADEATGLEDTVDPWVETIFEELVKICLGNKNSLSSSNESGKDKIRNESIEVVKNSSCALHDNIVIEEQFRPGLSIIHKLIASFTQDKNTSIPTIEASKTSRLSSSRLNLKLLAENESLKLQSTPDVPQEEMDRMTISTTSSGCRIHYSLNHPFQSKIVRARYLTHTSTKGAQLASDAWTSDEPHDALTKDNKLIRAMDHFRSTFPLETEGGEDEDKLQFSKNGKRVIEMTLSLPDDFTLEYKPGDSIGLVVSNSPKATRFVLGMLKEKHGILPTQMISIDSSKPITVEEAIRNSVDLCSPIKNKRILAQLSLFASDKDEEAALCLLASKNPLGERVFRTYIDEQCINVIDILNDFPSCQSINLNGLLTILPPIPPRYYSICSSPLVRKEDQAPTLSVVFSVVDYMTSSALPGLRKRRIGGLATCYLEAICAPFLYESDGKHTGSSFFIPNLNIFPKPTSEFHLPATITKPLILIGPGTGIAPFMGFLAHRKAQIIALDATQAAKVASEGTWRGNYIIDENDLSVSMGDASGLSLGADYRNNQKVGDVDVYFGCRYKDHDWLFRNEMNTFEKEGVISRLNISFSREGSETKAIYVQDEMKNNSKHLTQMIMINDATIYICGDGNAMARDVQSALVSILAKEEFEASFDEANATLKAKEYLKEMKLEKRLVLDIWS